MSVRNALARKGFTAGRVWAGCAAVVVVVFLWRGVGASLLDLRVYLTGGRVWLEGSDLYGSAFPGPDGLPFTYPPLAAALFAPLALLPWPVVVGLWTAAGVALLGWVCVLAAGERERGLWLASACLLLEPVRGTLELGQVNLLLLALVAADCLLPRTPWPRGLLLGIAASVKLTPAIFVLFLLSRKDFRAAATAGTTFAGCAVLGWLLAPRDSVVFWTSAVLDPHRVGGLPYAGNQSVKGVLVRLGLDGPLWFAACAVVLALLVVVLRGVRDDLTAVVATAAAGVLVSPVSWSHHWVWAAPALLLLHGHARVAVGVVLLVGPHWLLPRTGDVELTWAWWQHLVGDAYALLGLGLLVLLAWRELRRAAHPPVGAAVPTGG
ncbi:MULTISPECIES: glycosyltransferase 87 family protein [Actinosynnema]|uniref:glycosyltransferase 87 family protein n=1 Tax=Actinosynnema TaxID=40566 RepID=UPI0020A420F0|nr:glycosyltransferase 87 family protein [Actinosynnema pretiosum]MCP2097611.1 alpha-1,2-mannosyltransferase [Actinosynnema pretiosum]